MGFPLIQRLPLVFLFVALSLYVFAFFLFFGLDVLVNGDLYNYGLMYSDGWAIKYWSNSYLFRTILCTAIAMLAAGLVAYFLISKSKSKFYKAIPASLFYVSVLLAGYSLVFVSNLDFIVMNTLFDYSLNSSFDWVNSYWFYETALVFIVLLANIMVVSSALILTLRKKPMRFDFSRLDKFKLNRRGARWFLVATGVAAIIILFFLYRPTVLGGNIRYEPVLSGSMEPTIPVGSLVIISPFDPDSLNVGDVICYRFSDTVLITHRIVYVTSEGFETRGDANEEIDSKIVDKSQVVGSVLFSIPFLGYLGVIMKTQFGFLILLVIPASLMIGYEIRSIIHEVDAIKKGKQCNKGNNDNSSDS